jgi:hypothetical protein
MLPGFPGDIGQEVPQAALWLGDVEAVSEAEALDKGAEEFKQPKERLM